MKFPYSKSMVRELTELTHARLNRLLCPYKVVSRKEGKKYVKKRLYYKPILTLGVDFVYDYAKEYFNDKAIKKLNNAKDLDREVYYTEIVGLESVDTESVGGN
jgi:hypothetical protein